MFLSSSEAYATVKCYSQLSYSITGINPSSGLVAQLKNHVSFFSFFITVSIPVPCHNTSIFQACGNLLHKFTSAMFHSFSSQQFLFIPCRNTSTFQACGNLLRHHGRYLQISTVSREGGTFLQEDRCPHATCHRSSRSYIHEPGLRRNWVMKRRMRICCDQLVWPLPSRSFWLQFLTPTTQCRLEK